jgi:hypothetical protein
VTLPGSDSAVLAVTALVPDASRHRNYVRAQNAVLNPGYFRATSGGEA